jgi:hypothetical protein
LRFDIREQLGHREHLLHDAKRPARAGRNHSQPRHQRGAPDLIPLVCREICFRRHIDLLEWYLSNTLLPHLASDNRAFPHFWFLNLLGSQRNADEKDLLFLDRGPSWVI